MSHAVESMAYANEVPWHGLGYSVPADLTPEQMLKAAKIDWTVSKRDMFLEGGNKVPGFFALTRDSDSKVLSVVGSSYKETQNSEILGFFQKFVEAGNMDLETAGSLQGGRYIWALARINSDFSIGKQDEMRNYLLLCNPHVYGYARVMKFTSVRVVCWNTLNYALGSNLRGDKTDGKSFSIPHSLKFDDKAKEAAEKALGLAKNQAKEFEEAARLLARKKATKEQVEKYFNHLLGFDPEKAKVKKDGSTREPTNLLKFRDALEKAPGQDLKSAQGTWWGAFNAVSYIVDHEMGRSRDSGLSSAWLGTSADTKVKAFKLALEEAA